MSTFWGWKLWHWQYSALKVCTQFQNNILLKCYLIFSFFCFLQTSFNISLFTENSWKLQSAICFLIKFRPHNHRQISLLFLFVRLLRNNVVVFTGWLWLSLWWWTWCKCKKKKLARILKTAWKSISNPETHPRANCPRQHLTHRHTRAERGLPWNLSSTAMGPDGAFSRQLENLAVGSLCRWYSKSFSNMVFFFSLRRLGWLWRVPSKWIS